MPEIRIFRCIMLPILMAFFAFPSTAGNPLLVSGPYGSNPGGQPFRWPSNTVSYYTDLGGLGNQTNAEADSLVAAAFQVWADVETADIRFENLGKLEEDITADNIFDFLGPISS